jgi:succinate dehydrogenase/fumarate reductase cytochrome b subunit
MTNIRLLRKLHRGSGLLLALFIALHLFNHLVALESVERHRQVMNALRVVYRHPLAESMLLLAVLVQIPSGVYLVRHKGWHQKDRFVRWQVYAGFTYPSSCWCT